jgi:hypothetical protein
MQSDCSSINPNNFCELSVDSSARESSLSRNARGAQRTRGQNLDRTDGSERLASDKRLVPEPC